MMLVFTPYVTAAKLQIQPTAYQSQSLKGYMQNLFYKTIIDIYIEFCSRIWFDPVPENIKFKLGSNLLDIHEFFKQLLKLYFILGEVTIKITESEVELFIDPGVNTNINEDENYLKKISNIEIPFIAENFPPFFHIIELCERLKNLLNSFIIKQHILLNFVGAQKTDKIQEILKLDPNYNFEQNLDTLFELQSQAINQLRNIKVKEGTFISTIPGFEIDVLKNDAYVKYQELIVPLIEQISALTRIPSFLLSGNLERINYAASRAALSDFVAHTNSMTQSFADKFLELINMKIDYVLPLPLMHSGNELSNLLKTLEPFIDKYKLLRQLILSGLVS
ncbi:MAG: hypothetical protein QXV44_02435 [Candidatus Anstonellaceae archaeon]